MYGVYLTAVLVLTGGAIAYLGDRIGRSVGRRRLTLLGLRPKHTSVLITVMTGLCIVAATLGIMAWLSHDVRTALFHMQEIQEAYRTSRAQYAESQRQLEALQTQVATSEAYLERIVAARDLAAEEMRSLQLQNAALQDELRTAKQELEQWKAQVVELQSLAQTLRGTTNQLELLKEQLEERVAALTSDVRTLEDQLRQGRFVLLKGEILHAAVLDGGRSVEETETALLRFLEEAENVALQRGARIDGKERAIELAHEDYFFQTVDLLVRSDTPWVVRAVALQNTVQGEPLVVYFHLFPDAAPLYTAGEVILAERFGPGERDLEGKLLAMLQRVNEQAVAAGMITDGDGTVGEIPSEAFVATVVELRRLVRPAWVYVVAAEEVRITQGPLRVSFVVKEAGA